MRMIFLAPSFSTQENVFVQLLAEYNGQVLASLLHAFESQTQVGRRQQEAPERARSNRDRRMMHVLPPNVTERNDGTLHSEHVYSITTKGYQLNERQVKTANFRNGLILYLKYKHDGFNECLEALCDAYVPLCNTNYDAIDGPDLDRALCELSYSAARTLGGALLCPYPVRFIVNICIITNHILLCRLCGRSRRGGVCIGGGGGWCATFFSPNYAVS